MNNFLEMVKGGEPESVPFWFMRQAGRYLPEYRDIRAESKGFLDLVYTPEKACKVTLQPLQRFNMDAAIIFSDILVVPHALGQGVEFIDKRGPKLVRLENGKDISSLSFARFDGMLAPVYEAISLTRSALKSWDLDDKALIGFSGAPWTLACYMIEGGSSGSFLRTRVFAYQHETAFTALIDTLVEACAAYLQKQIEAGVHAVQIFDTWAGILDSHSFVKWVIEPTRRIVDLVREAHPDVPIIGFPRNAGANYLRYVQDTKVSVISIDSSVDTRWAARSLQPLAVVQGNLDPACLLAGGDALTLAAEKIISDLKNEEGRFVFNLGHGVHKDTPVENVEALVNLIQDQGRLR